MSKRLAVAALAGLVVATFLLVGRAVAAPLLQMDFGVAAGTPSPLQSGFQNMGGPSSLTSASGTFGPYSVNLQGQGFFNTTSGNVNSIDPAVQNFYRDYYYNNSTTPGVGVTLSVGGLTPNTPYNLTLWSYDADNASSTPTTWTPTGNTTGPVGNITNVRTPAPTTLADNSATIAVTSTTGTIDVFGTTTSGSGGTRLNGFRINDGTMDLLAVDFSQQTLASPVHPGFVGGMGTTSQAGYSQGVGPYTVSLAGQGFFSSGDARANLLDPSIRGFYRDYYYNNSTTQGVGVTLTIEGVAPNTDYDLTLWSFDVDNTFSETPTTWTPTGTTTGTSGTVVNHQTPLPEMLHDPDNSTTIRVRSTTNTLTIFGTTTGGSGGTRLNGIELNVVPEPSTAIVSAIGLVLAGGIRPMRRRRSDQPI